MERNNVLTNKNSMNQFLYDPNQRGDMQMLTVNLSIPIPADSVLISKIQLEEFKRAQLEGVYWTMKDLQKRINKNPNGLKHIFSIQKSFEKSWILIMADSFIIQNHKVKVGLFWQQKCPNFLMIILISFFLFNLIIKIQMTE
jgi:Domain of unknown function (DUF771)